MTLLRDHGSYEISAYTNPCSDDIRDNVDFNEIAYFLRREEKARIKTGYESFSDNYVELNPKLPQAGDFLLQTYPYRFTESPKITQWHNIITSWMPTEVKQFLLEQSALNKHIDEEPEFFLDHRIRELIFAHEPGDITKPLGVFALMKVYGHERGLWGSSPFKTPVYWEGRILAVEESRHGEGIGESLVIGGLYRAIKSGARLPLFANTANKTAANLFEKLGSKTKTSEDFPFGGDKFRLYKRLACWRPFENTTTRCSACPLNRDTTWYWETYRDSISAVEPLEQWVEQPTETRDY